MSGLYDKYRQAQLESTGGVAWLTDVIKAVLINTSLYTFRISQAAQGFPPQQL
jgi:hypothetical protein